MKNKHFQNVRHPSDHCFIKACITVPKFRPKPCFIVYRRLEHVNLADFSSSLLHTDWSPVFLCADVADQWTAFLQLFLPILDYHAPLKSLKIHNPSAPPARTPPCDSWRGVVDSWPVRAGLLSSSPLTNKQSRLSAVTSGTTSPVE